MNSFTWLSIAILAEVIATSTLKTTEGFSRLIPSLVCIAGYGVAFYGLSMALRTIPTGIAYAIWSGVGIVLVSLVAWIWFKQHLDAAALIGMTLILAGVIIVNVFSKTVSH
jgi:small multidrug resistance pump